MIAWCCAAFAGCSHRSVLVVGWVLLALVVALINASTGLTALWVLLAGIGFAIFILFPARWGYHWLAKKSGCLDAGSPSAMMMTVTILTVLVSAFYTDIIGIHAIFVSATNRQRVYVTEL